MMKDLLANSYLFGGNAPFVEELYEAYLNNPQSVPEAWREYFDKLQVLPAANAGTGRGVAHARAGACVLRPDRGRSRDRLQHRNAGRAGARIAPRDPPDAPRDLLRHARRGGHVHLRSGAEALDPAAAGGGARPAAVRPRSEAADPRAPHRGRDAGEVSAHALRRA